MDGFNVAAGVLSCVGLALLIKMMSNSKVLPYLFLGFICVIYLGMDVIGVAVAWSLYRIYRSEQYEV